MAADAAMNLPRPVPSPTIRDGTPPIPSFAPLQPSIANPPASYPPKGSERGDTTSPFSQTQRRRPLSSSSPNTGRSQGLQFSMNNSSDSAARTPPPRKSSYETGDDAYMRKPARESENWEPLEGFGIERDGKASGSAPITQSIPYRQLLTTEAPQALQQPQSGIISTVNGSGSDSRHTSGGSYASVSGPEDAFQPLQYHHHPFQTGDGRGSADSSASTKKTRRSSDGAPPVPSHHLLSPMGSSTRLVPNLPRPPSAYSSGSEIGAPGRMHSPQFARTPSPSRLSPDPRPMSYVDLLNVPYPQPPPAPSNIDNAHLRSAVGENASLLSIKKTLEMYRANVKKTNDPTIQYEFAVFMINAAQELATGEGDNGSHRQSSPRPTRDTESPRRDSSTPGGSQADLLREARHMLQKLSDRSYPYAQYYLADGYASGLFNKGVEDNDRAFPLFVAASKHGHAEAGYRAALCYEFGWGSRKDPQKAVQFYRQSASKSHPGAMSRLGKACLTGEMGLGNRYREGVKWLKRAAESADFQYNSAPYELGLLHERGFGDDIFKDESYAAQLFTQSADLGHVEANYTLGDSYEHGKLSCPRDPALSVHFYTGAAQRGHPSAMMALCAWYMVGAEPVLEKDENEAYEWAWKAAETGLPKAEYAVGYFTEMGIGCRRDPLESNKWYVKAADSGDERAKHRLIAIQSAASGGSSTSSLLTQSTRSKKSGDEKEGKKKWGLF
ncbi:MAG: hypothetical protein ASARMPRED_002170 [Alectoria sarmentosa]|nr:MAG: hypothetical protein ASARMPRED_002170 [Alectoria sarmentosa]